MGAWIEIYLLSKVNVWLMSHPTWVRGLKYPHSLHSHLCVDVAPYMGAWIEIVKVNDEEPVILSHPTWVRGLK